jgi:hypothetical protein
MVYSLAMLLVAGRIPWFIEIGVELQVIDYGDT